MQLAASSITSRIVLPLLAASMAIGAGVRAQSGGGCTPSLDITGRPCVGDTLSFRLGADPGCPVAVWLAPDAGPTNILGQSIPLGLPALPLFGGVVPPTGAPLTLDVTLPAAVGARVFYFGFALDVSAPTLTPVVGPAGEFTICSPVPSSGGLVLLDSSALDNGFSEVQRIANRYNVAPDWLVNDDMPTTTGNPWLRWNRFFPGDEVVLPGGSVDDEGWFTLPASTPWPVADFVAGTVPQSQLDDIRGVTALRNEELRRLLGRTLVAVVYDSDISMNYQPLLTNLQGARYGLFAFTVREVRQAGSIPESGSSTSLYDLVVRVEPPIAWRDDQRFPALDREPDSIQIDRMGQTSGVVEVVGKSAAGASARMFVTIEGFTFASPMTYRRGADEFVYRAFSPVNLSGRRVTISTDLGGAYVDRVP